MIQKTYCIYVDADACPVKSEIVAISKEHFIPVVMVASTAHEIPDYPGVQKVKVDSSDQSADLYILNHIRQGDVLVTGDYGLAAIALGKKAYVLSPTGKVYSQENIDLLLEERHASAKIRRAGGRTKGPKAFGREQRSRFHSSLTNLLQEIRRNMTNIDE